jgi:muconate cycloisomerase
MSIKSLDLYHLKIPCRSSFSHAKSSRDCSEVILLKLTSDENFISWGEVMPREYVTGESISNIMESDDALNALDVIGTDIDSVESLQNWVEPVLDHGRERLALVGGIELAMWGLLAQTNKPNLDKLIGLPRRSAVGFCYTIGFDCSPEQIRKFFIAARFQKATAIKLKVGMDMDRDIHCIQLLQKYVGKEIQLRLDGNGVFTMTTAKNLLSAVNTENIHSFEEPLCLQSSDMSCELNELHSLFGIDFMADESICSLADADQLIEAGAYQWFNIRLGKHGGLLASSRIRDKALAAGVGVVGGSMVGETSVLTQASTVFLHRSNSIEYIEGLGQNRSWLLTDPFQPLEHQTTDFLNLQLDQSVLEQCLVEEKNIH